MNGSTVSLPFQRTTRNDWNHYSRRLTPESSIDSPLGRRKWRKKKNKASKACRTPTSAFLSQSWESRRETHRREWD